MSKRDAEVVVVYHVAGTRGEERVAFEYAWRDVGRPLVNQIRAFNGTDDCGEAYRYYRIGGGPSFDEENFEEVLQIMIKRELTARLGSTDLNIFRSPYTGVVRHVSIVKVSIDDILENVPDMMGELEAEDESEDPGQDEYNDESDDDEGGEEETNDEYDDDDDEYEEEDEEDDDSDEYDANEDDEDDED